MSTVHYSGWDARAGRSTAVDVDAKALAAAIVRESRAPDFKDAPPFDDPRDPAIGKWAIVVREDDRDQAAEAFAPLLEHRREQGLVFEPFAEQPWPAGILPVKPPSAALSPSRWLDRIEAIAGSSRRTPHYLLLVGGPDRIPFEAQRTLDERFSTGRIDVGDDPTGPLSWEACRRYAEKVVAYEQGRLAVERRALVYAFATDPATRISYAGLATPLQQHLETKLGVPIDALLEQDATTQNLVDALGRSAPALVVTVSHGLELCEDPVLWGALTDATFGEGASGTPFSAYQVPQTAFGPGAIVLAFACYGAGIPQRSAHRLLMKEGDEELPGGNRTAALPRVLLAHPQGPIAFAGHVDRTTSLSFNRQPGRPTALAFENFASWTFQPTGTLGRAVSTLREEAQKAAIHLVTLTAPNRQEPPSEDDILEAWIAYHDLVDHCLLGDPVIRPALALAGRPRSETTALVKRDP